MISKTKQAIKEVLITLPENYQKVVNSFPWEKISKEIGGKHLLVADSDLNDLQVEVALVLLGLEDPENFESRVEDNVVVKENEAREIEQEVFIKIFEPIDKLVGDNLPSTEDKSNPEANQINPTKNIKLNPKFNSLSSNLQDAISKSDYQTKVYKLGKKYGLQIDQMGILEEVITDIMLGEIQPNQFENKLSNNLTLPKEKLDELVADVNKDIFEDIRHLLESNWEERKNDQQQNTQAIKTPIPVPAPPYTPKKEPPIPENLATLNNTNEQDIYAKSGIEILDGKEEKQEIEKESPITPQTPVTKNLIDEKLNNSTKSTNTVSDYSLPKISSNKDYSVEDPYREKI